VTFEYLLLMGKASFEVDKEILSSDLLQTAREGDKIVLVIRGDEGKRLKWMLEPKARDECFWALKLVHRHYQLSFEVGLGPTPK
jgi:5,10-methylenetetrahydrofolate reductase